MKIGIFDSGLGGLAIIRDILKILPEYGYVYLSDNARVPYGGRSSKIIHQFTERAVDFLLRKQNCVLVIVACNTATAVALRKIQRGYLPKNFPKKRGFRVFLLRLQPLFLYLRSHGLQQNRRKWAPHFEGCLRLLRTLRREDAF